jgi:hypothetical protein
VVTTTRELTLGGATNQREYGDDQDGAQAKPNHGKAPFQKEFTAN